MLAAADRARQQRAEPAQSALLKNNGVTIVEATELKRSGRKLAAWELKAYASSDLTDGYDLLAGIDSDYLHGIAKLPEQLVILLNLDRVLARDERRALEVAAA